jgi:amino acid adenylation domain-containing protein
MPEQPNITAIDWSDWHANYETSPSLQARLQCVRRQIFDALTECPPGPIKIISICAGDGRDILMALREHPRRDDVTATLIDNHSESLARGRQMAKERGLEAQMSFVDGDASLAKTYAEIGHADLVVMSGFLGHLRHGDALNLIANLPMLCKTGGSIIWNRHLVLHDGAEQVARIRGEFRRQHFEETHFEATAEDGFAVGRARFVGESAKLDPTRKLFEFVGIDQFLYAKDTSAPGSAEPSNGDVAAVELDAEKSLVAYFEQTVETHGARKAIGSGKWQPTYAELNASANSLAHTLVARGLLPGERVAVLMRQDGPMIAAIIAALKAAGVVIVLPASHPSARLQQICADAEPRWLVTDAPNRNLAAQIAAEKFQVINFEEHASNQIENPNLKMMPGDLAFLIYTSGTTGRPKGVMQTHRSTLHNALRLSHGARITAQDTITLLASPSGGQGLSTLWCAMLNGATLCPFAASEQEIASIKDWLTKHDITVYVSSVSIFRHFMKSLADEDVLPNIRLVRLGSEKASISDFAAYRKHFSDRCILFNSLSSSETGNVTQHRFQHGHKIAGGKLPVGWPAAGMEILLLDENSREVATEEIGEIIVRSRYLSPGYWRNESLTAERFSDDPAGNGWRRFRTGDFGSRDATGALTFMDRKDNRVKVHGYRIEISEIEDALNGLAEVEQALVSARNSENGDTRLIAHVVLRSGVECSTTELRRKLFAILPNYMVPANFVFLDKFPFTPHGKINRQALPAPTDAKDAARTVLPPRDVVEKNLAKIFETVLRVSRVGRRDDFFDLGGTSLQSVEAMASIEEIFNVALPPSTLIERSTVEDLAPLLSNHAVINSPRPLVTLREEGSGRPLFFIHSGQGDVVTYALLVRRLPPRPVYGLQAVGIQGESWPLMSIPEMAERYLPEILEKDPTGPYLLAGTCMGGMVAFELAQRLVRMGRKVNLLALIDSPTAPYSGNRPIWHEIIMDQIRDALRILRWGILRACGVKISVQQLPAYRHFVAEMTGRATRRYRPQSYPGTVTLMLTADTKYRLEDRRPLISRFARETRTFTIPGTRTRLFMRPQVDELARQLQACLEAADCETATPKPSELKDNSVLV